MQNNQLYHQLNISQIRNALPHNVVSASSIDSFRSNRPEYTPTRLYPIIYTLWTWP